jgi:hypothetical protein
MRNFFQLGAGTFPALISAKKLCKAAIVNVSRVIPSGLYHFVIAVWRAKQAESAAREVLGNHR